MTITANRADTDPAAPTSTRVIGAPIGPLTLVASDHGLRAVLWPDDDPARVGLTVGSTVGLTARAGAGAVADAILDIAEVQLGEYFTAGRRTFDVALDPVGTAFQHSVWSALQTIPYGATITYGEQAALLGDRRKARAVGAANGRNPISIIVPCHRVVGSDGSLTGFAAGVGTKAWLLEHEHADATRA